MKTSNWILLPLLTMVLAVFAGACGSSGSSSGSHPAIDDDTADDDDDDNDDDDDASPSADDDDDDDTALFDQDGRQIILRGANYMVPDFGWIGQTQDDFNRMAAWGFNIIRLPIAWSLLEPAPGVWNDAYLSAYLAPIVDCAARAGLRVLIDMHQWLWSPAFASGLGEPAWTCEQFADWPAPFNEFAEFAATGDFWRHPDYLDDYVEAWNRISQFFADQPAAYGFDLFNEPLGGLESLPWTFENPVLRPLYARLIATIHANAPEKYVFAEPDVINQGGFPFVMDPLPAPRIVYAPHIYPLGDGTPAGYFIGKDGLQWYVKKAFDEGSRFGTPTFIGETGISSNEPHADQYARDVADLADRFLVHYTWWGFERDGGGFGLLNADGTDKETFVQYFNRPYPQAVMGRIASFSFDADTALFTLTFANNGAAPPDAFIFVPSARHYPAGFAAASSDPDGSWTQTYDAASQILHIVADPAAPTHTITIRPSPSRAAGAPPAPPPRRRGGASSVPRPRTAGAGAWTALIGQPVDATNQTALADAGWTNVPAISLYVADTFTVPAGHSWTIQEIEIDGAGTAGYGFTSLARFNSIDCFIYSDAGGDPSGIPYGSGTPVWQESWSPRANNVTLFTTDDPHFGSTENSFAAAPVSPPVLAAGTYWLACVPVGDSTATGFWYVWLSAEGSTWPVAQAINPGGEVGDPFTTHWANITGISEIFDLHMAYALLGTDADDK